VDGAGPSEHDRAELLIQAGLTLSAETELEAVLTRIVELAVDITGARYGALGVLGEDEPVIERFITEGVSDEVRAAIGHPPTGHGILGLLIREARPIRIPDIAVDPRAYGFPPNHPPMHSFLGAPVKAMGRVFGNLYLTEKIAAAAFTGDDQAAIEVLATQAGVAIENARLYDETRRAQRELARLEVFEERERIARELHDGVIQSLFAVGMGLQGTAAMVTDEELARRLEAAVEEVDRAIRDLRNYIFGLRPGILADRQLGQALQRLVSEFQSRSGVVTAIDVDEGIAAELSSRAADIVQIAREALSNVERHAGAATCRVTLLRGSTDGVAELVIDDDGTGFDPGTPRAGFGLENLRERVSALGGTLEIESSPGEGSRLQATIPL
jgi:two-component system, NarL family, sensor histidine kinase DevS